MVNMRDNQRPITDVPRAILVLLLSALLVQITWHAGQADPVARAKQLPIPPSLETLRLISLGDEISLSKLTMLWLQAHDNQPGISIPFKELDYIVLRQWLEKILTLDPRSHYPLLAAVRVFGEVPVAAKQREMLAFAEQAFLDDPDRRWPWLAHAAYLARHRLRDQQLALRFAAQLAEQATGENVPHWAQQMQIFLLEDMGEIESAKVLLGALLESGQITDPNEQAFLYQRLAELEGK